MLNKILSLILAGFIFLNSPLALFAQNSAENQVSLTDIELLLEKQQKEFNKKVSIYGLSALGGVIAGGGIYAYYMNKQINILKKRNLTLSYKVSKTQSLADEIARSANSMNKKIAKNAKLVKGNKAYIDDLVKHIEEIIGALNTHTEVLNGIAEEVAEEAAEQAPRRPIGFHTRTTEEATKSVENLSKNFKKFKNKAGIIGLFVGGLIAAGYVYYSFDDISNTVAVNSKRVVFKRYLENSYQNDDGLFIFDVLALAENDRRLTAAILQENIDSESDYYARLLEQDAAAQQAAREFKEQNSEEVHSLMLGQVKPGGEEISNFLGKMKEYQNIL